MLSFLLSRLSIAVATIFVVVTAVFFLSRLTGDAVTLLVPMDATPETIEQIKISLGLDKPLFVQYFNFIIKTAQGDLGISYASREYVVTLIMERTLPSFYLTGVSIIFSLIISLPLGLWAGVHSGTIIDAVIRGFAFIAQALPSFFLAVLLVRFVAGNVSWMPSGGNEKWSSVILPAFTLAMFLAPAIIRLLRSSMIEVMQSDYIRFARLKGLSETKIIWKHALKNASIPILALTGLYAALSITIAVVVEVIFAWPGLGQLAYSAIVNRDFAVLQGIVIVATITTVSLSFFVDWISAIIDPRLKNIEGTH